MKTIVTLTSWKKRIKYVQQVLEQFAMYPANFDKIYLWLSQMEFPNREYDLPSQLLEFVRSHPKVEIRWTFGNEYNHKRWYVYPEHFEDVVVSVDDDAIYDIVNVCKAISYAVDNHCIVNLADLFYSNVFNHSIHKEVIHWYDNEPNYFTTFCAQCVIPPFTFPCECMTEEVLDVRRRICQRCDESWINPWLIAHRVKIYTPDYVISRPASYEKENTTWEIMNKSNGKFAFRDVQLFAVLNKFPYLFEQWTSVFRGYMKVKEDIPQILSMSEGLEIKEEDLNKIPDYIRNH